MKIRYYTPQEDEIICEMRTKNYSTKQIAEHLNRTFGSIQNRIYKLRQWGKVQ